MASVVDICNTAVSHLGGDADIADINELSAVANHCRRWYPMARDAVLEMHPWRFATKRIDLALLGDTPPDSWLYAYAVPTNALRVISIHAPEETDDHQDHKFIQETLQDGTPVIYTNVEEAICRYTVSVTDTQKFSPWVVLAIARLLASFLAGPIIKGTAGKNVAKEELKTFVTYDLPQAQTADASAQRDETYGPDMIPGSIQARA